MRSFLTSKLGLFAISYLVSWTIFYGFAMEGDFSYYLEYLLLAWTSPGETPSVLNVFSLIAALGAVAVQSVVRGIVAAFRGRRADEEG